jgi:hypothetical protein
MKTIGIRVVAIIDLKALKDIAKNDKVKSIYVKI